MAKSIMTQADFDQAVKAVEDIRARNLGCCKKPEQRKLEEFMGATLQNRKAILDMEIWASGFSVIAWDLLKTIAQLLRDREEDFPDILAYWLVDVQSGRRKRPRGKGQKDFIRNRAIADSMHYLVDRGWVASMNYYTRKKHEDAEKDRNKKRVYSLSAAGVCAKAFLVSESTSAKVYGWSENLYSTLYKHFRNGCDDELY